MISRHLIRFAQALALAAIVAAVASTVAYSSSAKKYGPVDGWYTWAVSLLQQQQPTPVDGRSPDTRDAAAAAQLRIADGRSPDTVDAAAVAHQQPVVVDGRSPDTVDAGELLQPIEIVQPSGGFDWGDAGIGAGAGTVLMVLLACSIGVLVRTHRRDRMRTA